MTLRIGGLFEGYGGLTMGVRAALGGELAWVSEIEPAAVRLLAHHHPAVPNLGDITAVDWESVEPVDVLTGGFPCQDVSAAGRRAGMKPGTRSGLWAHMARAINVLRPGLVVIENVRGLLSAEAHSDLEPCPWCLGDQRDRPLRALGAVLGDLAVLGYDARWGVVHASDAGAPHPRARVFIFAEPASDTGRREPERRGAGRILGGPPHPGADEGAERERDGHAVVDRGSAAVSGPGGDSVAGDPDGAARRERRLALAGEAEGRGARADTRGSSGAPSPDADDAGLEGRRGFAGADAGPAVERGGGAAADSSGVGWGEGRPEPAGQLRGSDAPVGGARTASDTPRLSNEDQPVGGTASGQPIGAVAGSGDRDRAGDPAEGVHDVGRPAGELAWGPYEPAIRRWEQIFGRVAPAPTQTGKRGGQQLSPAFVEWLMGLPEGHVTGVPGLSRNEQLKLLGNGVVPAQAELALQTLLAGVQVATL